MIGDQERALSVMERVVTAQALVAATRTGLLSSLCDQPMTIEALAVEHDLVPEAIGRLLDVLRGAGLVEKSNTDWRAAEDLRRFDREMPQDLSVIADAMARLPQYLHTGRRVPGDPTRNDYALSVDRLRPIFSDAAEELARRLDFEIDSVLDLGAGSGVFGITVAREHGASRLTGFDRPPVIGVFHDFVEDADLAATVDEVGGDFLTDELPTGFDCTLICNVLRILSADDARRLIDRAMQTLTADGRLVILDVMGDDPPDRALRRSIYRLDLALRSDAGGPHDDASIREWIAVAGGEVCGRTRLNCAPLAEEALVIRAAAIAQRP